MATEQIVYLAYAEAVALHIELMRYLGETRYGVFDRALIESALMRPRQAATYDNADVIAQAATLCFGLIKNHPWVGGNNRTATFPVDSFLNRNGLFMAAPKAALLELALAVESDRWQIAEIDDWLRRHTQKLP